MKQASNRSQHRKMEWWMYAFPLLLALTLFFLIVLYQRPGKIAIGVYYLGPLLVSALAVLARVAGLIYSIIKRPFVTKWRVAGFASLLLFPISLLLRADQSGNFVGAYPSSHTGEINKVSFRLPLDTPTTVGWGGDKASTNYHVTAPDQRWAYDLLVTKNGKGFIGDSSKPENYLCYGLPVLAPAAGEIVAVFDSAADMPIGDLSETAHAGGNQVVLKVAEAQYLFLCHLKLRSILVKKGDHVEQSQQLAQVGNSGHTSEPHIHIHLQDTQEDGLGEGIPLYFTNYTVDGKQVSSGMPTGGFGRDGALTGQIVQHIKRP